MDENLTRVLLAIITLIATIINSVLNYLTSRRTNKKVAAVETKLDHNFEQANGHFTKLLETTAKLSKEEGRKEEKAKDKNKGL